MESSTCPGDMISEKVYLFYHECLAGVYREKSLSGHPLPDRDREEPFGWTKRLRRAASQDYLDKPGDSERR